MSDQSNRSRQDQRLIAPQLITESSQVVSGNVTPVARPVTPLIVRTTGNVASPNVHRNLVFIRPSNVASLGGNTQRFIVQPVQQPRQILPQTVINQPAIITSSTSPSPVITTISSPSLSSANSHPSPQPPKMTARAALLQDASIPTPVMKKNVSRSFELRCRAIPGPKSKDSTDVAEVKSRLLLDNEEDDGEILKGEVIKRMQVSVNHLSYLTLI